MRLPRWGPLSRFVHRWYAVPLGSDVVTEDDLARAESRLGCRLNPVVREWFQLVGHRLRFCGQDIPRRLEELEVRDGRIVLWQENQGCWSAEVEVAAPTTDASVMMMADGRSVARDRLERALLGTLCSDTLVAVWAGNSEGPLGEFTSGVVGGYPMETTPEVESSFEALPALEIPNTPLYQGPFRGHESLVIRSSGGGWEWMAADDAAHAEARRLLALDDQIRERRLVVLFDAVPPSVLPAVQRWIDAGSPLGGTGRLVMAGLAAGRPGVWLEFDTDDPEATMRALLGRLPPQSAALARAGHRPEHTTRFVPCWPPDLEEFSLPKNDERYVAD